MDESTEVLRFKMALANLLSKFPKLKCDPHFRVTSPCNQVYNCIAWAMGVNNWWVDNNTSFSGHWWPIGVALDLAPESLRNAFVAVGFEECYDGLPEEGYDKVALYMDEAKREWTHAARILSKDEYHSKMGALFDIHHGSEHIFDNTVYGVRYAYMRRPCSLRDKTAKMIAQDEGEVVIT